MDETFPKTIYSMRTSCVIAALLGFCFAIFPLSVRNDIPTVMVCMTEAAIAFMLYLIISFKIRRAGTKQVSKTFTYAVLPFFYFNCIFLGIYLGSWAYPHMMAVAFTGILVVTPFLLNLSPPLHLCLSCASVIFLTLATIITKTPTIVIMDLEYSLFALSVALIFYWITVANRLSLVSAANKIQRAFGEINALKTQQDGDYYLTSLLINPLLVKDVQNSVLSVDFYISQNKKFIFKNRRTEIGGDICIAREITLNGKNYIAFTNGDAMGKSLQGAGGALVMATIFNTYINSTLLTPAMNEVAPDVWITEIFNELQRVFVSFDGSMLVSATIGLIDLEAGVIYYLNAEHPWMVCYRNGKAFFTENELTMHKIGVKDSNAKIVIRTMQLVPKDIVFLGSDGRDDVMLGVDRETGNRIINEDETRFLRCVEKADGDLGTLVQTITHDSEITDDFTLIRIEWKKTA